MPMFLTFTGFRVGGLVFSSVSTFLTFTGLARVTCTSSLSTGRPPMARRNSSLAATASACSVDVLPSSLRLMRRLAALPFLVEKSCATPFLACGCQPPPRFGWPVGAGPALPDHGLAPEFDTWPVL